MTLASALVVSAAFIYISLPCSLSHITYPLVFLPHGQCQRREDQGGFDQPSLGKHRQPYWYHIQ
jgi:hypothetical protein